MENIRYIKLKNKGGFVAKITVQYKGKHTDEHGNVSYDAEWKSWHSDGYRDICAAAERTVDLTDSDIPEEGVLKLSMKETMPHPFEGVETRHPIGSTRIATVVGKYGGGVFCRLSDNVTDVLCSYDTMHYDGDFRLGDRVEILIKRLNYEKKLVYGKMLRKMR